MEHYKLSLQILSGMIIFCVGSLALAAVRCGNATIMEGDVQSTIQKKCGKPAHTSTLPVKTRSKQIINGQVVETTEINRIERWVYKFDKKPLVTFVFENGVLTKINE